MGPRSSTLDEWWADGRRRAPNRCRRPARAQIDTSGSGNGVEQSQNGGPAATSVDHLEVGAGRFADRHQRGRELADDRESAWSKLTQQHGYDHRCDRCDPDDEELDRTE